MLIYSMREEADGIHYSIGLSDDDRKKYNTVSNKSKAHFVKRRNPIYKRSNLICVYRHEEGKRVDSFITSLYQLAEHCNYRHDLHNEMIQDWILWAYEIQIYQRAPETTN